MFKDGSRASPSSLMDFLRTQSLIPEDNLFWIRGKPGAGKSCFMKFLNEHSRIMELLSVWHPGEQPIILSFCFWLHGSCRQRNSLGLWSCLLFQLLEQQADLAAWLSQKVVGRKDSISDWSSPDLSDTFTQAVGRLCQPVTIFLDGLDEFDPDEGYATILTHVKKLLSLPRAKLVVSSRPEVKYQNRFKHNTSLRLQDLTT